MPRPTYKTELLSLDTIKIINLLYPKIQDFYNKHLAGSMHIAMFYSAMRHDRIDHDVDTLIESSLDYDLRHMNVTRESLSVIPPLAGVLETIEEALKDVSSHNENYDIVEIENEKRIRLIEWMKFYRAQIVSQSKSN